MTDVPTAASAGARVIIAEDDWTLALFLRGVLEELGCAVVGTAATEAQAERLAAEAEADIAILDIALGAGRSYAAADRARARSMGVIFTTGYDDPPDLPARLADAPRLIKPVVPAHLKRVLQQIADGRTA